MTFDAVWARLKLDTSFREAMDAMAAELKLRRPDMGIGETVVANFAADLSDEKPMSVSNANLSLCVTKAPDGLIILPIFAGVAVTSAKPLVLSYAANYSFKAEEGDEDVELKNLVLEKQIRLEANTNDDT